MIAPTLSRLLGPAPLGDREARSVVELLIAEGTTDVERAAVLVALAGRRETAPELSAFARELRRRARPFPVPRSDGAVDVCGSGGAPRPSFNVSTVSAFVVAAAGVPVVKHGNRSARGPCGSSDLLTALGLPVVSDPDFASASYRTFRLAFLHAPLYHPATAAVGPVRRTLGVPTLFNRLGPLVNPADVPFQVVGVPEPALARGTVAALDRLGVVRSLAMTSAEGCDEFSPRGPTVAFSSRAHRVTRHSVDPSRFLERAERQGPWGALDPPEAATEASRILAGGDGARRGSVLLTSGAAIWIAGRASSLADGVDRARGALDSGRAEELLFGLQRLADDRRKG